MYLIYINFLFYNTIRYIIQQNGHFSRSKHHGIKNYLKHQTSKYLVQVDLKIKTFEQPNSIFSNIYNLSNYEVENKKYKNGLGFFMHL